MSKIELTKEQVQRLRGSWSMPGTYHEALEKVANELVAMGLVRPASDDPMQREWEDVKARVAALEAYINGDEPGVPPNVRPPDPHAAAKDRAKLWGVELVSEPSGVIFRAKTGFWCVRDGRWLNIIAGPSPVSSACCYCRTPDEAWSNFPTEPPPGWEAAKSPLSICGIPVDPTPKNAKPVPRTDADRLGEACREAWWGDMKHANWGEVKDAQEFWRNAALAVRKAVLTSQLEPSEEEVGKVATILKNNWGYKGDGIQLGDYHDAMTNTARKILLAAARVRLAKAEGEKP